MDLHFEYTTSLQYKVKSLTARVRAFESGEKYAAMKTEANARIAEKDKEIQKLKAGLGDSNSRNVTVRKNYQQVIEDMDEEHKKELRGKDREIEVLKKKLLETQILLDAEKDKYRDKVRELYQIKTELVDEKGKNQALKAQINRDYENSSKPSSMKPYHKKIANNREKTGKAPGGQPDHEGHPRKRHAPTNQIYIPAPDEYTGSPDFKATGKTIVKQMVEIRVELVVDEYSTPEFRNVRTGQRAHAGFPEGVVDDVNYGGGIKAFAFLLNNRCNVSILNATDFLYWLTGGRLKVSAGMINGLAREFSSKTEAEQKKAFADMLLSPVINTDFTSARVNGKNANVIVCATPDTVLYFAREHKGHEGVKGTPVEKYQGILVHDHDKTFYNYGSAHQECLDHPSRYLKDSMENEPGLQWNRQMREHIKEMIHFRNGLDTGGSLDPDQIDPVRVAVLEARYDEILALAREEYEYEPPSEYYKDGFNLFKKMFDYRDNHLLFLHDRRVPHSNNLSERLLRILKRKQKQAMTFRSWEGLEYLCDSLGMVALLHAQGKNLYEDVASIFNRRKNMCGDICEGSAPKPKLPCPPPKALTARV